MESLTKVINTYVNEKDCVPRFSLANTAKLCAMICAADATKISFTTRKNICLDIKDDDTEEALELLNKNMEEAKDQIKDKYCHFQLVGDIHHITKENIFKVKSCDIDDVFLIVKHMLDHHGSKSYRDSFNKLRILRPNSLEKRERKIEERERLLEEREERLRLLSKAF